MEVFPSGKYAKHQIYEEAFESSLLPKAKLFPLIAVTFINISSEIQIGIGVVSMKAIIELSSKQSGEFPISI